MKLALAALLLLVAVAGGFLGWLVVGTLVVGISLTDQRLTATLPKPLAIRATVTNPLTIQMNGIVEATLPVDQTVTTRLRGRYRADLDLDTAVPLRFEIVYDGTLPVDTMADITANTTFNYNEAKILKNLRFSAKLPMKMNLPVTLRVPVDQSVRLRYRGQVAITVDQEVGLPLKCVIPAKLTVDQAITTPVKSTLPGRLEPILTPFKVVLNRADLKLPVRTLRLERADDPQKPVRSVSPWGDEFVGR